MKVVFLSRPYRFTKEHCCLEGSQASSVVPSGKSNTEMKVNMEHCGNETDRGNRNTRRKTCCVSVTFLPQISRGVIWNRTLDFTLRNRQLTSWDMAITLSYISRFRSHRVVNPPSRLSKRANLCSVYTYVNSHCLFWEPYKTQKSYFVGRLWNSWMLKLIGHDFLLVVDKGMSGHVAHLLRAAELDNIWPVTMCTLLTRCCALGVHSAQTGSGDHPASYTGDNGGSSGGKTADAWSWSLTSVRCPCCECMALYYHSLTPIYSAVLNLLKKGQFSRVWCRTSNSFRYVLLIGRWLWRCLNWSSKWRTSVALAD